MKNAPLRIEVLKNAKRRGFNLTRRTTGRMAHLDGVVSIDYMLAVLKNPSLKGAPAWSVLGNENPAWRTA